MDSEPKPLNNPKRIIQFRLFSSVKALIIIHLFFFLFFYSASPLIQDRQSFLFTLVNPSRNQPTRIAPKPGAAIQCKSDYGPTFGDSNSYYDLRVCTRNNSYNSDFDLGYGFKCPEKVNKKTYFAGVSPSQVSELEVFKVDL